MIAGGQTIDSSAPAAVRLVGDLVNTVEWQVDEESWTSASALGDWFAAHLGTRPTLTDDDVAMARQFREGLRAVLLLHAGHEPLPGSIEMLNGVVDRIALRLRFDQSGDPALVAPGGSSLAASLGTVLGAVEQARVDGSWLRLKACSRVSCQWAYWDDSRNRSGRWCSMAGCGTYMKGRRRSTGSERDEVIASGGERRTPTMVDVAARAGVSVKTVSNVVTGAFAVTASRKQAVEEAISALGYQPNEAARALRAQRMPTR